MDPPDSSPPPQLLHVPSTSSAVIEILRNDSCSPLSASSIASMSPESQNIIENASSLESSSSPPINSSSSSSSLYLLASPEAVEITSAQLLSDSLSRGRIASVTSTVGERQEDGGGRITIASAIPSATSTHVSSSSSSSSTSTTTTTATTTTSSSSSSPSSSSSSVNSSPPPPSPIVRPDRVIEFIALYSYDTTPFLRSSHTTGSPSGEDFLNSTKNALKGQLQYRLPLSKDRPKNEDLPEALEHFVYPEGLKFETQPTAPLLHSFVLTMSTGIRLYAYVYTKWTQVPEHVLTIVKLQIGENLIDDEDPTPHSLPHSLYGPHSLVIISAYPFYESISTVLKVVGTKFFMETNPAFHEQPDPTSADSSSSSSSSSSPPPPLSPLASPVSVQLIDTLFSLFKDLQPNRIPLAQIEESIGEYYPNHLEFKEIITRFCNPRDEDMLHLYKSNHTNNPHQNYWNLNMTPMKPKIRKEEFIEELEQTIKVCVQNLPFILPAPPTFDNIPLLESTVMGSLFDSLSLTHIIQIWNAILCECPVLFVSEYVSKLTPALETLSALLYPMKWPYVYIPVLPIFLTDVLDAPQPFLIGSHSSVLQNLPDACTNGETQIVIVDLDKDTVCLSGNLETLKKREEAHWSAMIMSQQQQHNSASANPTQNTTANSSTSPVSPRDSISLGSSSTTTQTSNTRGSISLSVLNSVEDSLPFPYPDPFVPNSKMITLLLASQGVTDTPSSSGSCSALGEVSSLVSNAVCSVEKLFSSSPVTYLGSSQLFDGFNLSPNLSLPSLNPFSSASTQKDSVASTMDGSTPTAPNSDPFDLDPSNPSNHSSSHSHPHHHAHEHYAFLPWNLVWRLFDGVSSILNPFKLQSLEMIQSVLQQQNSQQLEVEIEEHRKRILSRKGGSFLQMTKQLTSTLSSSKVDNPTDLNSYMVCLNLLQTLPPNLPVHAWPVFLPGLVKEKKALSMTQHQHNGGSGRKGSIIDNRNSEEEDSALYSSLSYIGNEGHFLRTFQSTLEKHKKPILLLSTTRYLYSGTDISESEGELLEDNQREEGLNVTTNTNTNLRKTVSQRDSDEEHSSEHRQNHHQTFMSATPQGSPKHSSMSKSADDNTPPAFLHATSTPIMHESSHAPTTNLKQNNALSPSSSSVATTPTARHASASVFSTTTSSESDSTLPASSSSSSSSHFRLTPLSSDDEKTEQLQATAKDVDPVTTNAPNTLTPPRNISTGLLMKRASAPSLGFNSSDLKNKTAAMSPFRQKQAKLNHLSPPAIGVVNKTTRLRESPDQSGKDSLPEESLTPLTPATPALFSTSSPMLLASTSARSSIIRSNNKPYDTTLPAASVIHEDIDEFDLDKSNTNSVEQTDALESKKNEENDTTVEDGNWEECAPRNREGSVVDSTRPSVIGNTSSPNNNTGSPLPSSASISLPMLPSLLPLRELTSSDPATSFWPTLSFTDIMSIRRRFLSVLVSLLHSHRAFTGFQASRLSNCNSNNSNPDEPSDAPEEEQYEITFSSVSFLKYSHRDYRPFMSLFLETQMFKFFTEERLTRESTTTTTTTNNNQSSTPNISGNGVMPSSLPTSLPPPALASPANSSSTSSSLTSSTSSNNSSTTTTTTTTTVTTSNDWFDRLCSQKRSRTRLLMNSWGENGKSGILYKLGRKVPTWKERYFELNRHGTILRYYSYNSKMIEIEPQFKELKKKQKLNPKDAITKANLDRVAATREKLRESLFRGEITLIPGQTSVIIPNQSRKYMSCYCFEIITPTRSLLACALDLNTRDEWIMIIRARAAKLSIDHKRMMIHTNNNGENDNCSANNNSNLPLPLAFGSIPHLESRLQMQLRLLREKNIQKLTKSFMDNLAKKQAKFIAGDVSKEDEEKVDAASSSTSITRKPTLTTAASKRSLLDPSASPSLIPLSLPHALLVCEHLRTSLDLKKFTYLFRSHPHCFSGRDATHYILHQNLCENAHTTIALMNVMLQNGLILNVNNSSKTPFKNDSKNMYTFPLQSLLHGSGNGVDENDQHTKIANLIPTEEERVIVSRMREELDVRDRVHGLFRNVHKDCFLAKDAIEWLLDRGICSNESSAIRVCTRLVRTNQIQAVNVSFISTSSSSSNSPSSSSSFSVDSTFVFENNTDLYRFHSMIRPMGSANDLLEDLVPKQKSKK